MSISNLKKKKKEKKKENHHRILHIRIIVNSKSQLQQTILIFETIFSNKDTSKRKQKKLTVTTEFFILELV